MILRPHQEAVLDKLRQAFLSGKRAVILYAPTGAGKTELAINLMNATADKGNRSAMVLDRIALCNQTSERLEKYSIDHGVLQSGHWRYRPDCKIQVCSAQTLEARGSFPEMSLLIVDEAHCIRSKTAELIKASPKLRVVGLSASPFTKGLGAVYDGVVSATTTRELVDDGWLAPLRVFIARAEIDMTGAKKVAGEWSQKDATDRGIKITGDVVAEWIKKTHEIYGKAVKTIVFCAGVAHGQDLSQKFAEAGYNFISVSYKDGDDFKADVIKDFSKPDTNIHGLIATDILTKGFDAPDVLIGVSARPFAKSFSSHVQQMGRLMRQYPGKDFAVWIDHSGNYLRFKDQWDDLYSGGVDELQDDKESVQKEPTAKEKTAAKCPKCGALWGPTDICIHCGHVRERKNDVQVVAGRVFELTGTVVKKEKYDSTTKERWYQELFGYARLHGYKDGWAFHKYLEKFGVEPIWKKIAAPISPEVQGWITYSNMKRGFSKK